MKKTSPDAKELPRNELHNHNRNLETRVVELTSELKKTHEQLVRETDLRRQADKAYRQEQARYEQLAENSKTVERDLRKERERMDFILRATQTNIDILDAEYNLRQVDPIWQKIYGNFQGRKCHEYFMGLDTPCSGCAVPQALATGETLVSEEFLPKENRFIEVHTIPFQDENGEWLVAEFNVDITERKQREKEKEKLETQLRQAQKMESVGRLAGGVAHDFNNMLQAILGHTELALEQVNPAKPLFGEIEEVRKAAERSAELTRQLLTFARKQAIAPRILDLNGIVEGMLKMLRRFIGEEIDLIWKPGRDLQPVKVDPAQIEQVLVNLCINARDAIAGVGNVTVETDTAVFEDPYCPDFAEVLPGRYILLAVSDDGCGMDQEILGHLFEPFFTTKGVGKGTGLGLATVYGIVNQNNGFINVCSAPDRGTIFKVHLPAHSNEPVPLPAPEEDFPAQRGSETILLVEDEPAILKITAMMLNKLGYTVIVAGTPDEAIRLAHDHRGQIDLLITDVVMPEMNGKCLAKRLLSIHPDLKCLFISGYTADVIANHGILETGVSFIGKPFRKVALAAKVREVLGSGV